jgi:hypothetical protein
MEPTSPTRRSVLAAVLAAPALVATGATSAQAAAAPETIRLPDGFRPEGITSGAGGRFWTGSLADGRLYSGDLATGRGRVVAEGQAGKSLRGMQLDGRSGLVWVAGNEGALGTVYAYTRTGGLVHRVEVPGAVFLNDVVVTRDAVWVTDSSVDRLTRLPLSAGGVLAGPATFLPLTGAWPTPEGLRANGIRELDRDTLVVNNSTAGGLWAVPKAGGVVTQVEVVGGPGLTGGDGLERSGDLLYDVRGSGQQEVSVLALRNRRGTWTAVWRGALTDETLSVPSTATRNGRYVWAVNARFGVVPDPATAEYYVTRLPARP